MLVTNLDYDEHKGRIAIGRITSGKIGRAEGVVLAKPGAFRRLLAYPLDSGRATQSPKQRAEFSASGGLQLVGVSRREAKEDHCAFSCLACLPESVFNFRVSVVGCGFLLLPAERFPPHCSTSLELRYGGLPDEIRAPAPPTRAEGWDHDHRLQMKDRHVASNDQVWVCRREATTRQDQRGVRV